MTAHEDHPQLVVSQLFFEIRIVWHHRGGARQLPNDRVGFRAEDRVAPDCVDGDVVRDAEQPAGGVVGRALIRPRLQRADHRLLHRVLGERHVRGTDETRQAGRDAARLMPEQVVEQNAGIGRLAH
jgi:hypothetical protein